MSRTQCSDDVLIKVYVENCYTKLLASDKYIWCEKYEARLSKECCRQRRKYARLKHPIKKYNGTYKITILPSMYAGCRECREGME